MAVSKSTDGGMTWSEPTLTGTPIDRAWLTTDLSTGRVYMASGDPPLFGTLGPESTADPNAPVSAISDRWLASSRNGEKWTPPERYGGGSTPQNVEGYPGAGSEGISDSAAHGVLAAVFQSSDPAACAFFVSAASAPCTVFQTTRNSGRTWNRHQVPVPSDSTGTVLVAADPARAGTFTVAELNSAGGAFLVYETHNFGKTWRGPATVTDNPNTTKFKPWIAYSPQGTVGLMWRSNDPNGGGTYKVFAAVSFDQGRHWSDPLQVSTASSPAPDRAQVALDDTSMITLNNDYAFLAWGDWRPGEVQGFFSAVKLQAFSSHHR
jgi:hypothetical protein